MAKEIFLVASNTSSHRKLYPYNLLLSVKGSTNLELPRLFTKDVCAGIQYALSSLTIKERELIRLRYMENRSISETASLLAASQAEVKQLERKAISKLRQPPKWNYVQYGIAGYLKQKTVDEYNKGYNLGYRAGYQNGIEDTRSGIVQQDAPDDILNLPIEVMNLTTRVYNSIHRAGFRRIHEIAVLGEMDIWKIKNLGRKGANEIARKLLEYGIKYTAWNRYLL